jgi:hypothetical protein
MYKILKNPKFKYLLASFIIFSIFLFLLPSSIEGSWGGKIAWHGCDAYAFIHFSNGNIFFCHQGDKPRLEGTYKKVGFCRYELSINGLNTPWVVKSKLLWISINLNEDNEKTWGIRSIFSKSYFKQFKLE